MTNSMPHCTRYEDDLKAYADGELSWLRRQAIRRHLTHCASCQKEILEMTQIAEDLRSAEPPEALSPALRERILGVEPTPSRSSSTLPKREGEEFQSEEISPVLTPSPPVYATHYCVSGGPLQSDLSRSKEVGSRKPPKFAWGLAGAALVAWFIYAPIFLHSTQQAQLVHTSHANRVVSSPPAAMPVAPANPQALTFAPTYRRVSDANGNQNSLGTVNGSAQTFDSNHISAAPDTDADSLRQVHKEASLGIQVANPEATGDTINAMVKETGGYVASNNLSTGSDGLKSGELIVKVPVTQFETFLAQVAKLGVVQSKNISGEDITEQTSDASQTENVLEDDVQTSEARLKSLGAKAKWHDEQATRDLRIQLAQAQARLVLLKRMAALGTLTIDLSQTPKAVVSPPVTGGFLNTLKATTHDALHSLIGSAGALLALVIWLLAYAPVWVPLLLLGRYALKEYRKREAA